MQRSNECLTYRFFCVGHIYIVPRQQQQKQQEIKTVSCLYVKQNLFIYNIENAQLFCALLGNKITNAGLCAFNMITLLFYHISYHGILYLSLIVFCCHREI